MVGKNLIMIPEKHFFWVQHGIYFRKPRPHTTEQNRVVKRKHHHIVDMARTFLLDANLHGQFQVDETYAATIINRLPMALLDSYCPFAKLFHEVPDYCCLHELSVNVLPHF